MTKPKTAVMVEVPEWKITDMFMLETLNRVMDACPPLGDRRLAIAQIAVLSFMAATVLNDPSAPPEARAEVDRLVARLFKWKDRGTFPTPSEEAP